jgi:hypothetical protein
MFNTKKLTKFGNENWNESEWTNIKHILPIAQQPFAEIARILHP